MRNLDRLNQLLKNVSPLPTFRQVVGDNFSNLHWLQKHVAPKLEKGSEVRTLLEMTQPELMQKPAHLQSQDSSSVP